MRVLTDKDISEAEEYVKCNNLENITEKLLFMLGFKSNLLGTKYLANAVEIRYGNAALLSKDLYLRIAERYGTEAKRVEHGIRHSITECHNNGCLSRINELFKSHALDIKHPPTNKQLISALCTWIHIVRNENTVAAER